MKEMQQHLKVFDERKIQEIAARAYKEQEAMKLKVIIKTRRMSSFDVAHHYHVY